MRICSTIIATSLLLAISTSAGAQLQPMPEPLPSPPKSLFDEHGDDPPEAGTPAARANEILKGVVKCRQYNQLMDPRCAIKIYHQASEVLREANVETKDEPVLWWMVFQGVGTSLAQMGNIEKALTSFQAAGQVYNAPLEAREESAYFVGRAQHALGMEKDAVKTFDVLFTQNRFWVEQAVNDPLLETLRENDGWKEMIQHHQGKKDINASTRRPPEE